MDGDPGWVVGLEFPSPPNRFLAILVVDFEMWAIPLPLALQRGQSRVKSVLLSCSGVLLTLLTTTRQAGAYNT